jgi:hypothetical protein
MPHAAQNIWKHPSFLYHFKLLSCLARWSHLHSTHFLRTVAQDSQACICRQGLQHRASSSTTSRIIYKVEEVTGQALKNAFLCFRSCKVEIISHLIWVRIRRQFFSGFSFTQTHYTVPGTLYEVLNNNNTIPRLFVVVWLVPTPAPPPPPQRVYRMRAFTL